MKKFLCLFLSVLLLTITACTTQKEENSEPENSTIDVSVIDVSSKTKTQKPLSETEVKEIFEPLLSEAISVQETILNDSGIFEYKILDPTPVTINGNQFYLIEHSKFKSVAEVWDYVYSAYTNEAGKRIFSEALDPTGVSPRFIEQDGKLYYNTAGHGYVVDYPIDTLKIIEQYDDTIIVSIDFCSYDYDPENSVYVMCKTEKGWRMANSENEAVYELPKQFIK